LAEQSDKGLDALKKTTGLPLSTYFSGPKLRWMMDNVPEVKDAHDSGDLYFGTVDSWVLWNMTGGLDGGVHLTDCTNASRTMFMDLETLDWSQDCLDFFKVDKACLPKIVSNAEVFGKVSQGKFKGFPIAGLIGDQQAALVGNKVGLD
jgi:glycerol kinase